MRKAKTSNHAPSQTRALLSTKRIADFCSRNHIVRLSLFGSRLRGDFRRNSDVDMLVEFEEEHIPGLLGMARMERELSLLLRGKRVDLRTPQDLSRYFRETIMQTAQVQYERI